MAAMYALHHHGITMREAWEYDNHPVHAHKGRGIAGEWLALHDRMLRCANGTIRDLVKLHDRMIETRSDLSECQKNARRKRLIEQWKTFEGNQ